LRERTRCPVSAPYSESLGLGVLAALPLEGLGKALLAQVLDAKVEAVIPASGGLEDAENGVHYAASPITSLPCSSSFGRGGSNAARMTLAVCWITSKLSARSEALPWYRWM